MKAKVRYALKYLQYWWKAKTAHGIHSPFVFHFITEVLHKQTSYYVFRPLGTYRQQLAANEHVLKMEDHGAGSRSMGKSNERKIKEVLRNSVKAEKYARLLFRMIQEYRIQTTIELGTSLGLTTLFLSYASDHGKVFTIEGDRETAQFAMASFKKFKRENIDARQGLFNEVLPALLNEITSIDLAFIDGHHTSEATLANFEALLPKASRRGIFVIDDIHWSADMESAWEKIKEHPRSQLTIDLFEMGLVFLEPRNQKEHFVIRY